MPDSRHRRISALFLDALTQPEGERAAFVASACDDASIREEVRELLRAHVEAEAALTTPLFPRVNASLTGQLVGPWRLEETLGEGGMGVVYRGRRADGAFEREVAVKLLRPGLVTGSATEHFDAERRLLARLEHPGIARLYDGGVTDGGLPYLAMELVRGNPLTDYAANHRLTTRARLDLFLQACDAVAYAHRRLVVHRDLKPSNLFVTESDNHAAEIKLLDFGIAKLLSDDSSETTHTASGPLTPAYAAPEQVRGEPVTTATDVYSLGVVLYELLTGQRPYDTAGLSPTAVERLLTASSPRPPSAAGDETAHLDRDLDVIVMKAMQPDPERRYATAAALAEDLRRFQSGLPVEARVPSTAYRVQRFVRRHRLGVMASAATALALVIGLGAALWQAREASAARDRAERRFEVAREAARAMLYDVHDAIAGLPGSTPAREKIVTQSLDYLNRLAEDAGPSLRIDLAGAYLRIGNVQGNPTNNNLGRIEEALQSYRRGLALLPSATSLPDSLALEALSVRARLHEKLGITLAHASPPHAALAHLDQAVSLQREALALDPNDADRRATLAAALINRGDITGHPYFPNAERGDEALADYRQARGVLSSLPEHRHSLFSLRMLSITHEREGTLLRDRGALDEATAPTLHALDLREQIADRPDATTDAVRDVGVSHEALGRLYGAQGRTRDAVRELREAVRIYERLAAADPENADARETVGLGALHLGEALTASGRPTEGRAEIGRARRTFEALAAEDPDNQRLQNLIEQARTAQEETDHRATVQ